MDKDFYSFAKITDLNIDLTFRMSVAPKQAMAR